MHVITNYVYHIPVLQVIPSYRRSHPPGVHTPVTGSQGWLIQWQVSSQLCPNFPGLQATDNTCIILLVCIK